MNCDDTGHLSDCESLEPAYDLYVNTRVLPQRLGQHW